MCQEGKRTAVVSGAGPAGSLMSIYLARAGWDVQVFEAREQPERVPGVSDPRAYSLNISLRGRKACEGAGVNMSGLHNADKGDTTIRWFNRNGKLGTTRTLPAATNTLVYRTEISRHLLDAAADGYPDNVSFHYQKKLVEVDFERQVATFEDGVTGEKSKAHYDLLIGADGVRSAVRGQMADKIPGFHARREDHAFVFKLANMQAAVVNGELDHVPGQTFLDFWDFPLGWLANVSTGDGTVRCLISVRKDQQERLGDPKYADKLMTQLRVPPHTKQAILERLAEPGGYAPISSWTWCSSLVGPKVALIGDAAHSVTPVLGQGCNSSLEDCAILARCLADAGGNIDTALIAYNAARHADATALTRLNQIVSLTRRMAPVGAGVLRMAGLRAQGLLLNWHVWLRSALHWLAPWAVDESTMLRMLEGKARYSTVFAAIRADALWLVLPLVAAAAGLFLRGR